MTSLTQFKVWRKNRTKPHSTFKPLNYGQTAILSPLPLSLTSKQLFSFLLFIKKIARRSEKTFRFLWVYVPPYTPLTRKSHGQRMGKGKNKRKTWKLTIRAGQRILEFANIRLGRLLYFKNRLQSHLHHKLYIYFYKKHRTPVYRYLTYQPRILPFW